MSFAERFKNRAAQAAMPAPVAAAMPVAATPIQQPNGIQKIAAAMAADGNKKRTIAMITDRADALDRVADGEAKRPAPSAGKAPVSVFMPPPVQADGTTPADKAMQRAKRAADYMMVAQYNIVIHFVILAKLLQQSTTVAVVGESAADLARKGQY